MDKFYFRAYSILIVTMSILTIPCLAQSADNQKWKEGILVDEFIYDSAEFPSVHAATIAETPSGLITAFFGGKYEGHPEVNIYTSRHTATGWTPPVKVADGIVSDTLRKACYNPGFSTDSSIIRNGLSESLRSANVCPLGLAKVKRPSEPSR